MPIMQRDNSRAETRDPGFYARVQHVQVGMIITQRYIIASGKSLLGNLFLSGISGVLRLATVKFPAACRMGLRLKLLPTSLSMCLPSAWELAPKVPLPTVVPHIHCSFSSSIFKTVC